MDDFYLRRSLIEADYISQGFIIFLECVMCVGGGVFEWWHAGVCESENRGWLTVRWCVSLFLSSRLPEPRAEPMNRLDFEDNDSGPSMDHAPWHKRTRSHLTRTCPSLSASADRHHRWAVGPVSLSLSPSPSILPPQHILGAGRELTLKEVAVTNTDGHVFSAPRLFSFLFFLNSSRATNFL